jgi:serine/threonine-protein kinase
VPVDHLTPTRLAGRYVLRELIASGGMGEVHLALDERLGRQVAVKVLTRGLTDSPESVERFRREALAAAGLTHPNIARVYDYGVDGDRHFIVMEYLPGVSLHRLIRERGPLPPGEAADIAAQVCAALGAAHRAGIVHRDVKPGNVVVAPDGTVKVTDFGIAKAVGAAPLTDTGTVLGTATYLPPEVGRGASAGPASDLYSLGIVLYEMLTGEAPFTGEGPVAVAMRHVSEDVPPPSAVVPGLPHFLDEVVTRAAAKEPAARYASAEAMGEALRRGDTQPLQTTAPAGTQPMPAWPAPTQAMGSSTDDAHPMTRPLPTMPVPEAATQAVPATPLPHREHTRRDRQHNSRNRQHTRPRRKRWAVGALAAALIVGLGAFGASLLGSDSPGQTKAPPVASPTSTAAPTTSQAPSPTAKNRSGVVPTGLVGSDLASAERAITSAGLSYEWRMVASDAPRNQVIEASPAAEQRLEPGDTVQLVVSRGPAGAAENAGNNANANGTGNNGNGNGNGKGKGKGRGN